MTKKRKIALIALSLSAAAILGLVAALAFPYRALHDKNDREQILMLQQVMELIRKSYVDDVDGSKLIRGAINGMLTSLDPHSTYLPPDSFSEMKISTTGSFGGLGIEITLKEGKLTVISPIEDTPAFRAGIKSGDFIVKIDNTFTRGMTINDAVKRMRGEAGTNVTLTISREGLAGPKEYAITRDIIKLKSVKHRALAPGYGYIRIAQFQEATGSDFAAALDALHKENGGRLKGLVLDLRNNPGGLLEQAVSVANRFIGEDHRNSLIVYTKGRVAGERIDFHASIGQKEPSYPMVILINGGSASASEIVAGALQDHGRAVVMGTQSFGKGSVQTMMPLRGNSGLLLTTARYYTPGGRSIQATGITPDIIVQQVEMPAKIKEGLTIREKDLSNHISNDKEKSQLPDTFHGGKALGSIDDYQLFRSLELLRGLELVAGKK